MEMVRKKRDPQKFALAQSILKKYNFDALFFDLINSQQYA